MLQQRIVEIGEQAGAENVAAAFYDYKTKTAWSYHGDAWFHAASTIKVAVLLGLFDAIQEGRFAADDRLHVRNRFLSAADGEPFFIEAGRDANDKVHGALGKTMRLRELAYHMIVTSSNLATNLLVDLVGVEAIQETLERLGAKGIEIQRGVEDEKAFQADINNRVTACGLLELFRIIYEKRDVDGEAAGEMLDILHEQRFNSGIPAGLPDSVRDQAQVAHKTGEISSVAHDAGLVFIGDRKPYALVILTSWTDTSPSKETVADISEAVYEHLIERIADDDEEA